LVQSGAYMGQFQVVQTFVREANRVSKLRDLKTLITDAIGELGFEQFAFMHHMPGTHVPDHLIRISNYPEHWIQTVAERGYFADDPVFAACQRSP
jgi:hypothetical protein